MRKTKNGLPSYEVAHVERVSQQCKHFHSADHDVDSSKAKDYNLM